MNISVLLSRKDMEIGIMCHKNHELQFYFNYIYCYIGNRGLKFKGINVILVKLSNPKHHRVVMIK